MKFELSSDDLADALAATVAALITARADRLEQQRRDVLTDDFSEAPKAILVRATLATPVLSRAESTIMQLADHPGIAALELAVRFIGERAHAAGLDMGDIARAAAQSLPNQSGRCMSFLNRQWDGIGGWRA